MYKRVILEELDYLCKPNNLQVPSTSIDEEKAKVCGHPFAKPLF